MLLVWGPYREGAQSLLVFFFCRWAAGLPSLGIALFAIQGKVAQGL